MFEMLSGAGVIAAALIAPPCWELIGALSRIDPGLVNDSAQVDLIVAWERQAAYLAAMSQPALVAVAFTEMNDGWDAPHEPEGSGRAEIGAALRLSPHAAERRLLVATDLCGRLACVQRVLSAGEISYWHAAAIVEATLELSDGKARWVAEKVLSRARIQSVAELKRALRRAVLKADPKSAKERAAQAKAERSLDWWTLEDGMAEMRVVTSAADILAMVNAVDAMARQDFGSTADGSRIPVAGRRADALVHLVTATDGTAADEDRSRGVRPKATVHLTMDLPTALGFADNPADLAGYGPIDAATARALAADASWRRLVFEPLTGALLDLGHTGYQPNAALTRYIQARDVRCQFPHCNQPAHRSHLDHTRKYDRMTRRAAAPTATISVRYVNITICSNTAEAGHCAAIRTPNKPPGKAPADTSTASSTRTTATSTTTATTSPTPTSPTQKTPPTPRQATSQMSHNQPTQPKRPSRAYIALATADVVLAATGKRKARWLTKPLLMPTLLLGREPATQRALALGGVGDVALLGDGQVAFTAGLATFMAGHAAWIAALRDRPSSHLIRRHPWVALPYAIAWMGLNVYLWPRTGRDRYPVLAYSTVLAAMALTALDTGRPLTTAGGVLFLTSDALLALERFGGVECVGSESLVMATYTAAQALLAA